MRKLVILCLLLPLNGYCQNAVKIIGNLAKLNRVAIERIITVPTRDYLPALAIATYHQPFTLYSNSLSSQITYNITFQLNSLKSPDTIYGPYNYMRAISKVSRHQQFVHPDYTRYWKHLNSSVGYNGVHHLITKSTIKQLCSDVSCSSTILKEMQSNAPCIFHRFHGNPSFVTIFHNPEEQYELYIKRGMKKVVELQLDKINEVNKTMGLPELTQEYIDGILHETKIWCSIYGLIYE